MKDYAVLIPTKGRAKQLRKLFQMCPSLNAPTTYVGLDDNDCDVNGEPSGAYADLLDLLDGPAGKANTVLVSNFGGYTSVAREKLRQAAIVDGGFRRYVLADDNCLFTDDDLKNLLAAQTVTKGVMGGFHPTAAHFHADQIDETSTMHTVGTKELQTYEQVGMIFWCVPHRMYKDYVYPTDCYFDDVHFIMWMLSHGFTDFRCCVQAKFNKHLHEPGGTGDVATRIRKRGQGFIRLATDFPEFMTTSILTTRVPYKQLIRDVRAGRRGV